MRACAALSLGAALCAAWSSGAALGAVDPGAAVIPRMEFEPLAPGTYELQHIQPAPDAVLLDADGKLARLRDATRGKVTLLTFFYTYCVDPLGCPYSHAVLTQLHDMLPEKPPLAAGTRFVSVSFDPTHDTPAQIAAYAGQTRADPRLEWRYFTARAVPDLLPVLDDLGQDVSVDTDDRGRATRTLHHMLKMFLIDRDGTVREIYTLAFMQPQVMYNDIVTLLDEQRTNRMHTAALP